MNLATAENNGVKYNVHGLSATWVQPTSLGGMLAHQAPSIQVKPDDRQEVLVLPHEVVCAQSCELDLGIPMASTASPRTRKHLTSLRIGRHERTGGKWNK